jgi:hypothetical protein
MRLSAMLLVACLGLVAPLPALAATFGELTSWCAPESSGGRPGLCTGYLETYLEALASPDQSLNDGTRACVPENADRSQINALIQSYAKQHPEAAGESGVRGLGLALGDRYPCPK